ncbi:MAG: type I-C CRISPR-associated protein Cas5c [Magnetococcus sp. XQGC-1]
MNRGKSHCLEVWGEFACFTRPEMKVERYSYPVITPSAARGIFDAIYWKPDGRFFWQVERVELLSVPRYIALRRNEVKDKIPVQKVTQWMRGEGEIEPLWADGSDSDTKGRTQRQTMALKEVRYRLHAYPVLRGGGQALTVDAQFRRRAEHGKCHYQPYLGCREFPAYFRLVAADEPTVSPVEMDMLLGWMLYDVFDLSCSNGSDAPPRISLFNATLQRGVMEVPSYFSPAVHKVMEVSHA